MSVRFLLRNRYDSVSFMCSMQSSILYTLAKQFRTATLTPSAHLECERRLRIRNLQNLLYYSRSNFSVILLAKSVLSKMFTFLCFVVVMFRPQSWGWWLCNSISVVSGLPVYTLQGSFPPSQSRCDTIESLAFGALSLSLSALVPCLRVGFLNVFVPHHLPK